MHKVFDRTIEWNRFRIRFRSQTRDILRELEPAFPSGWRQTGATGEDFLYTIRAARSRHVQPRFRLYAGARRLVNAATLRETLEVLRAHVDQTVAENARDVVFVHAGVVEWHDKAIVIPGRSRAGKSTLVHALLQAGAGYYSDEYAVLDGLGRVRPYRRPLSLRTTDNNCDYAARSLGRVGRPTPLKVGLVLVTEYRHATHWSPQRLTGGQGFLALLSNTILARRIPERAMVVLRAALSGATVWGGYRGEAKELAASLLQQSLWKRWCNGGNAIDLQTLRRDFITGARAKFQASSA